MLEFEEPIKNLEDKIEELRNIGSDGQVNIVEEINVLQKKCNKLIKDIYSNLTPWQITQIARHPNRPYTLDYIKKIFKNFHELHGDRAYADDNAIVSGIAQFNETSVAIIGHEKGRGTNEKIARNFGMARPEGFRKALRIMKLAERFNMPIVTFIDTPGAYPGIDAEERGQSEAIANNLLEMSNLSVPILSYVIGGWFWRSSSNRSLRSFINARIQCLFSNIARGLCINPLEITRKCSPSSRSHVYYC